MKDNKWKCPKCGRSFSRTGQGHYCGKVETIDEYIDAQDESVKPYLNEIRQILRSAIPEAQEKISWSMPTYWKGANIIHFAASKKHIGLYPGDEAPVVFADQLAGYDVSKGTIRIPYISPLPKDLIANIARWCYEEYRKCGFSEEKIVIEYPDGSAVRYNCVLHKQTTSSLQRCRW